MDNFDPFAGSEIECTVDSTEAQREIWLAIKIGDPSANLAYNESITLHLDGDVDERKIQSSLTYLINRHQALRSTFSTDGTTLIINKEADVDFEQRDFSRLDEESLKITLSELTSGELNQPFDLVTGPLIRFKLLRLSDSQTQLLITAHHIICDGWSFGVLIKELDIIVSKHDLTTIKMDPAPAFVEHAISDRAALFGSQADSKERYWRDQLGSTPAELNLPTDYSRSAAMIHHNGVTTRSVEAKNQFHLIDNTTSQSLVQLSKSLGVGMPALLLGVFTILLKKLSAQDEFVVGVPAAAQAYTGQYGLVGHCVKMLPISIRLEDTQTLPGHLNLVRTSLLDGFENQVFSFGTLLQRLPIQRDSTRVPLIPVVFNLDQEFLQSKIGGWDMRVESNPRVAENFELFVNIVPIGGKLRIDTTYKSALFNDNTIKQWLASFAAAVDYLIKQEPEMVSNITCLTPDQKNLQLQEFNNRLCNTRADGTVLASIQEVAAHAPSRIALRDAKQNLSYGELDLQSSKLATELLQQVDPQARIGVCMSPSVDLVIALLGIWKAGCAYVPLDADYPDKRLRHVLFDSEVRLILGDTNTGKEGPPEFCKDFRWIAVRELLTSDLPTSNQTLSAVTNEHTAYIIHTSGSTGNPKGVSVNHGALNNFMCAMHRSPGIRREDTLLAITSLCFDISILEIFLPLYVGASVVLAPRQETQDSFALAKLLNEHNISMMQATPSGWRALLEAGWEGNPKLKALCGGEELPLSLAKKLSPVVGELWNMYGPTEATVWSTIYRVATHPASIELGRPIDGTSAYVLDNNLQLLPPGANGGELFLGGAGIASGYVNQPDLTAEKFLIDPYSRTEHNRLYKTGDRVRIDSDGRMMFHGRLDHQAKIRGFRVELPEIESTLLSIDGVASAVAVVSTMKDGDPRLITYIQLEKHCQLQSADIIEYVRQQLPPQCTPQYAVILDKLPLTENGKVNRRNLPDPMESTHSGSIELTTPIQNIIGKIWCDLLGLEKVGADADFFLAGGHSMTAIRMFARIREETGLELPLQTIFLDRTIANLATRVAAIKMNLESSDNTDDEKTEVIEF